MDPNSSDFFSYTLSFNALSYSVFALLVVLFKPVEHFRSLLFTLMLGAIITVVLVLVLGINYYLLGGSELLSYFVHNTMSVGVLVLPIVLSIYLFLQLLMGFYHAIKVS